MTTLAPLKLFTSPDILERIGRRLLLEFLRQFQDTLTPEHSRLLAQDTTDADFISALAAALNSPATLPAPMYNSLRAIEELADPENRELLAYTVSLSPLTLGIEPQSPPVLQALQLWLYKPFSSQNQTPAVSPPAPTETPAQPLAPPAPATGAGDPVLSSDVEQAPAPDHAPDYDRLNKLIASARSRPALRLRPGVFLYELEPRLFRDFIHYFLDDLRQLFPRLPQPTPGSDDFAEAVGALLADPENLPSRMYDTLLAIEELAAPANQPLLRGLLKQTDIAVTDSAIPPEELALQFWLRCPFTVDGIAQLREQLPPELLESPEPNGQNAAPSVPHSAFRPPNSSAPGDFAALAKFPRYRISRLPAEVRESINQMLRQRIPYAKIIESLGEPGKALNRANLSRWKKTGYLLWLAEQEHREDALAQLQLLYDLAREDQNGKLHQATQQIAALRISQVLASCDPASLTQSLQQHPQALVRLVQTLPTLSRGGMDCERFLVEFAERKAALQEKDNSNKRRCITQRSQKYIAQKLNLM